MSKYRGSLLTRDELAGSPCLLVRLDAMAVGAKQLKVCPLALPKQEARGMRKATVRRVVLAGRVGVVHVEDARIINAATDALAAE